MKHFILFLLSAMTFSAKAESIRGFFESPSFDQVCHNSVVYGGGSTSLRWPSFAENDSFVFVGMSTSSNSDGPYSVTRFDKNDPSQAVEVFQTQGKVYDILFLRGSIWLLQRDRLISFNLENGKRQDLALQDRTPVHPYDHAYDMATFGSDKIVISDGAAGLKVIDITQMKVDRTIDLQLIQGGKVSLATSMAKVGNSTIFVGVDNLTLPAGDTFNGLIEVDLNTGSLTKYPYGTGVFSQTSKILYNEGTLWLNNWGILQYASVSSIRKSGHVYTQAVPFKFLAEGKTWTAAPVGETYILGDDLFTCAKRQHIMTTQPVPPNGIAIRRRDGGQPGSSKAFSPMTE